MPTCKANRSGMSTCGDIFARSVKDCASRINGRRKSHTVYDVLYYKRETRNLAGLYSKHGRCDPLESVATTTELSASV